MTRFKEGVIVLVLGVIIYLTGGSVCNQIWGERPLTQHLQYTALEAAVTLCAEVRSILSVVSTSEPYLNTEIGMVVIDGIVTCRNDYTKSFRAQFNYDDQTKVLNMKKRGLNNTTWFGEPTKGLVYNYFGETIK